MRPPLHLARAPLASVPARPRRRPLELRFELRLLSWELQRELSAEAARLERDRQLELFAIEEAA
jgi:hypothetical protein